MIETEKTSAQANYEYAAQDFLRKYKKAGYDYFFSYITSMNVLARLFMLFSRLYNHCYAKIEKSVAI